MPKSALNIIFALFIASTGLIDNAAAQKLGDWEVVTSEDDFTDEVSVSASTYVISGVLDEYTSLGLRCIDEQIHIKFYHEGFLALSNEFIAVKVRVDKNKTLGFVARMYSNSHESGYIPYIAKDSSGSYDQTDDVNTLLEQMKAGTTILIELNSGETNAVREKMSLSGFTEAHKRVKAACG